MKKIIIILFSSILLILPVIPADANNSTNLGKQLFYDSFKNNNNKWPIQNDLLIKRGKYYFNTKKRSISVIWKKMILSDNIVQVKAEFLKGRKGKPFGLIFRAKNHKEMYLFLITGSGHYSVVVIKRGKTKNITGWKKYSHKKAGAITTLTVITQGNRLLGYIGKKKVFDFKDNTFSKGKFGMYASIGTSVVFDDLKVWAIKSSKKNSDDKIESGNKDLTKNDYNSFSGFTVGMTMNEAKNVFRQKVIKTGILDLSKKSEKDYLKIIGDYEKHQYVIMGCYNSYAGLPPNSPPELFIDVPSNSVAIIRETVIMGLHSKKTVKAKTKKMLVKMRKKLGKYTKKVSGYWGGYIWKKGNYRVAMHYENFAGGAQFVIYRTEKKYIKDYFFINRYWQRLKKFMK